MSSSVSLSTTAAATAAAEPEEPLIHHCPRPGCHRQFSRKYSLGEHMKSHTGERPHVCPVQSCAKRFTTSGNLARHKRIHGYIEPLKCPVDGCICTFPSHNKLEKHMKFHYGGPVHFCDVPGCGKTFTTTGNLNRHHKSQHQNEPMVAMLAESGSNRSSPTTTDAWQPPLAPGPPPSRLKRAWSTGTNPLPAESSTTFNRIQDVDDTMDTLTSLLVETGLDCVDDNNASNLLDDMIRFHVQDLGYS